MHATTLNRVGRRPVQRQWFFLFLLPHPGMLPNEDVPQFPILSTPRWAGAERSPVERSEAGRSGAPVPSRAPDRPGVCRNNESESFSVKILAHICPVTSFSITANGS